MQEHVIVEGITGQSMASTRIVGQCSHCHGYFVRYGMLRSALSGTVPLRVRCTVVGRTLDRFLNPLELKAPGELTGQAGFIVRRCLLSFVIIFQRRSLKSPGMLIVAIFHI